jgi:hypothetical protein
MTRIKVSISTGAVSCALCTSYSPLSCVLFLHACSHTEHGIALWHGKWFFRCYTHCGIEHFEASSGRSWSPFPFFLYCYHSSYYLLCLLLLQSSYSFSPFHGMEFRDCWTEFCGGDDSHLGSTSNAQLTCQVITLISFRKNHIIIVRGCYSTPNPKAGRPVHISCPFMLIKYIPSCPP